MPPKSAQLLQKGQFAKLEDMEEAQELQENQEETDDHKDDASSDATLDVAATAFAVKRDLVLRKLEGMGTTQNLSSGLECRNYQAVEVHS